MSVRDFVNKHNTVFVLVVAALVLTVGVVLFFLRGGTEAGTGAASQLFFTVDDGKNWFRDDARKIPPFNKDGKEAFRAHVYQCSDGKQFVAYVERFTPAAKAALEAGNASNGLPGLPSPNVSAGVEVKRPGQAEWVKRTDRRALAIMTPQCPKGGNVELVFP
jgi:hypothetical protein